MEEEKALSLSLILGTTALLLSAPISIRAEDATPSAPTLEQRLSILERKFENDQEAAAKAKDGFAITSNDGNFSLKIGGLVQIDYRDYQSDHGSSQFADQFLIRRARIILEGTVNKYVSFRLVPDFANGGGTTAGPTSSLLPDAYVDLTYIRFARLRAGKFKSPISLEQLQSDPVRWFNEVSLATQLGPNRDTGVQLSGNVANGAIAYQAAVLNGVANASSGETDTNDGKDYVGRLFVQPFKAAGSEWINGFGAGIAGSIGDQFGNTTTSNLTAGYRTDGQQMFFTYQSGAFANGERKRIAPQAHWFFSHLGLLGEYLASSQEIKRVSTSTTTATVTHRAWQIAGSYVLTGERPSYNGIKPRKIFDPKSHGWGAFEIIGRYAIFRVDDETFVKGFAVTTSSARKAKSWSAGLNWYLNTNVRINSHYAVTSFVDGAPGGLNRPTEKVLLSRAQVSF